MAIQKCVVAVPARLQSSRLPNKVLADIGGKPMIQRVLERCRESTAVDTVVLCTDSQELQQRSAVWGFPVLMTAESCSSGSDRIASVADALMALAWGDATPAAEQTAVINVQGDQPFIDPQVIDAMAAEFRRLGPRPSGRDSGVWLEARDGSQPQCGENVVGSRWPRVVFLAVCDSPRA